jgi:hypothetical protein
MDQERNQQSALPLACQLEYAVVVLDLERSQDAKPNHRSHI